MHAAALIVSNASVTCDSLVISLNSSVTVTNGTFTIGGAVYSGSFVWQATTAVTPSPLPFHDGFDKYPDALPVAYMGAYGWSCSNANAAALQGATTHGGSSLAVQALSAARITQTIANSAGVSKVWTDLWIQPSFGSFPPADSSGASVKTYFTTNGCLAVHTGGVWVVCSNDNWGASVSTVNEGQWARLTIFQNYSNQQASVFLNGHLLRQNFTFAAASPRYSLLEVGRYGTSYLDDVTITNGVPPGMLSYDFDGDGVPDAQELHQYGSVMWWPGSVLKFR
jgi:hypothetical protein